MIIGLGGLTSGQGIEYFHDSVPQLGTVQLDTDHGAELIDSPAQLERYRLILDRTAQAALTPAMSLEFIHQLSQDL
ncbi:Scr1 family TA system antitoxin-like transcriptional regulator [Streptomyces sp. NPDC002920]